MKKIFLFIFLFLLLSSIVIGIKNSKPEFSSISASKIYSISSSNIGHNIYIIKDKDFSKLNADVFKSLRTWVTGLDSKDFYPKFFRETKNTISLNMGDINIILSEDNIFIIDDKRNGLLNELFGIYYCRKNTEKDSEIYASLKQEVIKHPW